MSLLTTAKQKNTKSAGDDKEIVSSAHTRSCSFLGDCLEMKPVDSSATPYDSHFCGALNSCKSSFFLFCFFSSFSAWVLPGSAACLNLLCQSAIFLLALSSWVLQRSSVSQKVVGQTHSMLRIFLCLRALACIMHGYGYSQVTFPLTDCQLECAAPLIVVEGSLSPHWRLLCNTG